MTKYRNFKSALLAGVFAIVTPALAENFDIPGGDLKSALDSYTFKTGVQLIYSSNAVVGAKTRGAQGELSPDDALSRILGNTGFVSHRHAGGTIAIVKDQQSANQLDIVPLQLAQAAAPTRAAVETVTVTSSKLGGADVQSIPIAITALSQEQLTSRQVAGGPDLVKEVPNLTFSKTNFTGYNIEIRGIGTQAISVTTDPAVAVALNDIPFIRNHFFEQEFYDVSQAEVLRGPQGTLYGRNATAGVVNIISAKPTDQFEAMASADIGNYKNRRLEGMINLPIVDDRLDLRLAGEWTKRDGYSFNSLTNHPIDGRDLWSGRLTIGFKPTEKIQAYLIWEHFQEKDDRIRSSKQLCKRDNGPETVGGISTAAGSDGKIGQEFLSQGCVATSLYGSDAFETPNGLALPYYGGLIGAGFGLSLANPLGGHGVDNPYADTQSSDLREIASALNPKYSAKNDVIELNVDYAVTPSLKFTSQTGYNHDFLWSTEDYNRFNTNAGIFDSNQAEWAGLITPDGKFCDPQLGCSDRLVAEDLSDEHAWQFGQEFRLASDFKGRFNFSAGGNYLHYETGENYYVFINSLTMFAAKQYAPLYASGIGGVPGIGNWIPGVSDNEACIKSYLYPDSITGHTIGGCQGYIDPNPIPMINNQGHNYFLSQNPYVLDSYAGFGEAYFTVSDELKLTGGLRWTDDQKGFTVIPSQLLAQAYGYPTVGVVNQEWNEWTGRLAANWTPKLEFTDQTLLYASFAHGYKAGGANPPGAELLTYGSGTISDTVHPLTFKPEFINSFELGTKNTLFDGGLTLNGDLFYYDYKAYQISEIVDRTAINQNFDATVKGAELEATWEPAPGLKFSFAGGYEDGRLAKGSKAVDLMDRTAGNSDWVLVKPFVTQASNCILPTYLIAYQLDPSKGANSYELAYDCGVAYNQHLDPLTNQPYQANPPATQRGDVIPPGAYPGFDPLTAPNNGEGFNKDLGGNELPNAPHFTTSLSAEYTLPVSGDWAATMHADFYWQDNSWARVFNDDPYDRLHGYTNVNFALILTSQNGWQAVGYVKNVFDTTAITGAFLNSDDTGLTTNVFLTDPRLFGVRITKNW